VISPRSAALPRHRPSTEKPSDGPVTSPEKTDQIARRLAKGSRGGRPPVFDPDRNVVERFFNLLKQFRDLANRYVKRAAYYRTELIIASIVLWLRTGLQDTT